MCRTINDYLKWGPGAGKNETDPKAQSLPFPLFAKIFTKQQLTVLQTLIETIKSLLF